MIINNLLFLFFAIKNTLLEKKVCPKHTRTIGSHRSQFMLSRYQRFCNRVYVTLNLEMFQNFRQDMCTEYSYVRFILQCGLTNPCLVVSGWFVAPVSFSNHCSILSGKLENTSRLAFNTAMNDLLERARASSIVVCDSVVGDCVSVIATIQRIKSNDLKHWVLAHAEGW